MLTFLLWRSKGRPDAVPAPERVAAGLERAYETLFADLPPVRTRSVGASHLAFLEVPVKGWKAPFFEAGASGPGGAGGPGRAGENRAAGDASWALAPDYPLNARTVLRSRGTRFRDDDVLHSLARGLEADPEALLRDLTPPFSLVWSSGDEIHVQNDGLGQAQLFEYEDDGLWAVSNRIFALRAAGATLEPDSESWAVRFTLGWFPLDLSGYARVRYVEPGTHLRIGASGVKRSSHDAISDWVHPPARSPQDCLDIGLESIRTFFRETMELWTRPSVGLSGGWDSRALVSVLRNLDADVSLRVRGSPERYDVMISAELARIADMQVRVKNKGGMPPDDAAGCKRSIERALFWQGGHMATLKHKTFLANKTHLDGGVVNVMGQHGGFGKADFARKIKAWDLEPAQYEDHLADTLLKDIPPFAWPGLRQRIRDRIIAAYRQADRYDLVGLARLDFFFMVEYTRRWSSASLASQPGLVVAPYLNPDFIRACYAYPAGELPGKPFHEYITRTLAPEWGDVIYTDNATPDDVASGLLRPVKLKKAKQQIHDSARWKKPRAHHKYGYSLYWRKVGAPLICEAFAQGGFWTTIFDPDSARAHWNRAPGKVYPDSIAIAHTLPGALQAQRV